MTTARLSYEARATPCSFEQIVYPGGLKLQLLQEKIRIRVLAELGFSLRADTGVRA